MESQIGIISLYRQQTKLLAHLMHSHKDIEFLTVDRSQGRDKDCIVISMVKSNTSGQVSSDITRGILSLTILDRRPYERLATHQCLVHSC